MRRIGHRGAMGHEPENTVASFEKAIALGCDEVETDVWLHADGALIISHDRPSTNGTSLTLADVLDLCRGRVAVNVELKGEHDEAAAARTGARVAAQIAARQDPDVYVSSFWWGALAAARDAASGVRRAFVFADSPDRPALIASARSLGLWALHPNRAYVTRELVDDAHAAGLTVNAWTVN
ncbi:MAG: glycerophosphodiester phosphodiesterase, partial [Chloroflexota bacterium]|nr:glycerophosphodiester phosphodiesterase [Chloroflexota bacterium]